MFYIFNTHFLRCTLCIVILVSSFGLRAADQLPSRETVEMFFDAIESKDLQKVEQMLVTQFPGSYLPDYKVSPLEFAIWNNDLAMIKLLVSHGADVNSREFESLYEAATRGQIETVKYLIEKGANIDSEVVSIAGSGNQYEMAKYLLLLGANATKGEASGKLWIFFQAVRTNDFTVLNLLKLSKEEYNYNNCDGETALIIAVKMNNIEMLNYLLQAGADKNKEETFDCGDDTSYGSKPIDIARKKKFTAIIKLLK